MNASQKALVTVAAATLLWPSFAFAKRLAPSPVPPIEWQGIEYRVPLDVEHLGIVQAFEPASGRQLWETKVYPVSIKPFLEEDVQWVFISSMQIQHGRLLVINESRDWFELDLLTGHVLATELHDGGMQNITPWHVGGTAVLALAIYIWLRWSRAKSRATSDGASNK